MGKARGGLLAVISLVLTAIFYGRAFYYDLQCDDLLVIRPWSRAELFAVWHGTWEPSHAFATFFRPVATWFYAGTFELFGLNAQPHMLLSLAMLATVAWLIALFVARESGSSFAAGLAVLVYLMHPNVPWSTGTWVTNDFHKLTAISALCALLLWQRVRSRPPSQWLLATPFIVICFLVKEDGLMLIPALISIQWLRARLVGDVKAPSLRFVAGAAAFGAALVLWRYAALRELGGFGIPPLSSIFQNLARGPLYAFTFHGSLSVLTTFQKVVALAVAIFVGLGLALMPREKRFLPLAALVVMFWYDLPLSLISNVMRYYMLTIASVMVLVPVYIAWANQPTYKWVAAVPLLALVAANTGARRQAIELQVFAPCHWAEYNCIGWVLDEVKALPPEARQYVANTDVSCRANPGRPRIGDEGTLTWGLGPTSIDTMTGERSNAVTGDVIALVRAASNETSIAVRHPDASAASPVRIDITADGERLTRELTSPNWTTIDAKLSGGWRVSLRGAHRVDLTFSRAGAEMRPLVGEPKK